jgi:trk system potassium uptake protein
VWALQRALPFRPVPRFLGFGRLGVDVGSALDLVGGVLKYVGATFVVPLAVALALGERWWPFLVGGLVTIAVGVFLDRITRGTREQVGPREGFLVVALIWLAVPAFGCIPFVFSGAEQLSNPMNAYFEAVSGFTATGATVVQDVEALPDSVLLWRQLSNWLGGMGIIVLALAVLPRLKVGGRQLLETELPGPEIEKLTLRIREIAQRLWLLYVALTALEVAVLTGFAWTGLDAAMSFYDAVAYSFTTIPTGGFATDNRSVEGFGAASQWAILVFMLVAGANFALLYRALARRQPAAFARDEEFRLYLVLAALASVVLVVELWVEDFFSGEEALRHGAFTAVSTMTTTGFATTDFNQWTLFALVVIIALMFTGGQAGSTTGSVKVVRHLLMGRILRRELDQTVHPEVISRVRLNARPVDERTLRAVTSFVLLYVGVFALGALLLVLEAARTDIDLRLVDAIAASAATLGNGGSAFGFAGPMGTFEPFSDVSKVVMIVLMWVGRLEIIPVAVLLTRNYWRV